MLLAPDKAQIERELDKLGERSRVLGLRSPTRRAWPEYIERGGRRFHLAWCESQLELRERLDALEDQPEAGLVLLTPLDDSVLGDDIRARLYHGRLRRTDRWAILCAAFRVSSIDPRLRRQPWLADLLINRPPPPGGYAPAPGNVLDLETAWTAFREHGLGMSNEFMDLAALIEWTLDGVGLARLVELPATEQAAVIEQLSANAGLGAGLLLGAAAAGRGADALAIGLACGVLFGENPADPDLRAASVRLEPWVGGADITHEAGEAFATAAKRVLTRLIASEPARARAVQARAESLLTDVRAEAFAALSPALDIGLEARMKQAAGALMVAAASGRTDDAADAWRLASRAQWPAHDRARDHAPRLERLAMAARLACWIAKGPRPLPDGFLDAAMAYSEDGSFVDWARKALMPGDPIPELAAAYGRLTDAASARREAENRVFAQAVGTWTPGPSPSQGVVPIDRLIERILAPLSRQSPVLLLVLDGLSFAAWRELAATLPRQGWSEFQPLTGSPTVCSLAILPTVTEVSRASLFCGRLARGQQSVEKAGFASHAALVGASRAGRPPLLFHKGDLGPGPELASAVGEAIGDPQQRVVAVVHNALDAQLSGSDQIEFNWTAEGLRQVAAILRLARDAGRSVMVTGDHGHVVEAGTTLSPNGGGGADRWRPAGTAAEGEVLLAGARVLAPDGATSIVAAWSERLRYAGKRAGYHGGVSPQEVLVPVAVLCAGYAPEGWDIAPPIEPPWWRGVLDEPLAAAVPEPPPARVSARARADTRQPDLFAVEPRPRVQPAVETPGWVSDLLASDAYRAQRLLAGRGAPPDEQVQNLLLALSARRGRLSRTALAQALAQPAVRIGGLVNAARRLLNLDQAQVLSMDGEDVILDERLLQAQFQLGAGR